MGGTNKVRMFVAGLAVACLGAPFTCCFAQGSQRAVGLLPPARPKVTTPTTDTWQPKSMAYIKASNTKRDAQFGYAVAISGDGNTLAVGAVGEDSTTKGINSVPSGHAEYAGAVYVYTRSVTGWKQQAYVKASNTAKERSSELPWRGSA